MERGYKRVPAKAPKTQPANVSLGRNRSFPKDFLHTLPNRRQRSGMPGSKFSPAIHRPNGIPPAGSKIMISAAKARPSDTSRGRGGDNAKSFLRRKTKRKTSICRKQSARSQGKTKENQYLMEPPLAES